MTKCIYCARHMERDQEFCLGCGAFKELPEEPHQPAPYPWTPHPMLSGSTLGMPSGSIALMYGGYRND